MVLTKKARVFFVLVFISSFLFAAQSKVALVIGNADYKSSPLKNPVNDAKAMRKELTALGFDVIYAEDVETADEMDKKLGEFYKASKASDIALLYFSGHGIQSDDVNYLLPISSDIKSEDDLKRKAIDLEEVILDSTASGARQLIVLIDACRNNPLKKTRGASRGLTTVRNSDLSENYIAFACSSGKTAEDGDDEHSPFTQALINHIGEQGVGFSEIMRKVTADVQKATNNQQTPNKSDNLTSEIYLNGRQAEKKDDTKPEVYHPDNTDTNKIITICVSLFCALLAVMILCFIAFTEKGRWLVAQVCKKTKVLAKSMVDVTYEKTEAVKNRFSSSVIKTKEIMVSNKDRFSELKTNIQQKISIDKTPIAQTVDVPQSENLPFVKVNDVLCVSKTPVTVGQYKKITGIVLDQNENIPVNNVTWKQAAEFFNKLSVLENLEPVFDLTDENNIKTDLSKNGWRFPTEQEWCSFAETASDFEASVWYSDNSGFTVHECGQKQCNKFGLYDVYGLVWEMCNDVLKDKYHIVKGGAWDCSKKYCKKSARMPFVKSFYSDAVGFRGVRNV